MTIDGIISSPSFIKIRTTDKKEHYINSNLVVSCSTSEDAEDKSDIVMLNGKKYTVNEKPGILMTNNYRRDIANGSSIINFLG